MSPRETLALVTAKDEQIGDESPSVEMVPDFQFQLRVSLRVANLEHELESHRHALNRITTALATRGIKLPADLYADSLTPL